MQHHYLDDTLGLEIISDPEVRALAVLERDLKQPSLRATRLTHEGKAAFNALQQLISDGTTPSPWHNLKEPEDAAPQIMGKVYESLYALAKGTGDSNNVTQALTRVVGNAEEAEQLSAKLVDTLSKQRAAQPVKR